MVASLGDVPLEIVLEYILPSLPLKDIARLSRVSRYFNAVTLDSTFWRLKTTSDFSFSPASHPASPSSGWWQRVYLGLLHPQSFVWGTGDNGRLGGAEVTGGGRNFGRFVDTPAEIEWCDTPGGLRDSLAGANAYDQANKRDTTEIYNGQPLGVVDMQAGGWSFTARCSDGSVWVWGQMNGTLMRFRAPSWEDKHCQCPRPTKIPLPCKAEAISAGRSHLLVLDSDNLIWEMTAWGKAFIHTAPVLTSPSSPGATRLPHHVFQLSTGWNHSAALTSDGNIYVWFPFSQEYQDGLTPDDQLNAVGSNLEKPYDNDGTGEDVVDPRGVRWGKASNAVLHELPSLPSRPDWTDVDLGDWEQDKKRKGGVSRDEINAQWTEYETLRTSEILEKENKVVKIASGLDFLIALKGNGEVWYTRVEKREPLSWIFLPYFSSPKITHITAQFQSVTSYVTPTPSSPSSEVYHTQITGDNAPPFETPGLLLQRPDALAALQNKEVIQVASGDYHYAALTSNGEMYTWGQGTMGQLGTGLEGRRGGHQSEPQLVKFRDDGEDAFVFSITAAGWHTGALVLGSMDPGKEKGKGKKSRNQDVLQRQQAPVEAPLPSGFQPPQVVPPGNARTISLFPAMVSNAGRGIFRSLRGGNARSPPREGTTEQSVGPDGGSRSSVRGAVQDARLVGDDERSPSSDQDSDSNQPSSPAPRVPLRGIRAMPFRIGFAGRGAMRARGTGQGPRTTEMNNGEGSRE